MRLYPQRTMNPNVPLGMFLIAETEAMSGEIRTTYYADRDGSTYGVGDWSGDEPQPTTLQRIAAIIGQEQADIQDNMDAWAVQS